MFRIGHSKAWGRAGFSIEDCVAAYEALLAQGYRADRVAIVGDSAGGGLALALLIAIRDAKLPLPASAVLWSPWLVLACTGASMEVKAGADVSLNRRGNGPVRRHQDLRKKKTDAGASAAGGGRPRFDYIVDDANKPKMIKNRLPGHWWSNRAFPQNQADLDRHRHRHVGPLGSGVR